MLQGTGPAVREEEEGEEEGHRALSSLVGWEGKERNLAIAETALEGADSGGKEIGLQPGGRSGTMCQLWAKTLGEVFHVSSEAMRHPSQDRLVLCMGWASRRHRAGSNCVLPSSTAGFLEK